MLIGVEIDAVLLKRDRVRLGYSQRMVRDLLKARFGLSVSDRYPMRWENGARVGAPERFRLMCELLGHPPERYRPLREKLRAAGFGPEPAPNTPSVETVHEPGVAELLDAITGRDGQPLTRPICVLGAGGHGLVSRAVWSERVATAFDAVAWVHCVEGGVELSDAQLALAQAMGFDDGLVAAETISQRAFRAAFIDRLWSDERRVLLVLDAVTSRVPVEAFLPRDGNASAVVLTTAPAVAAMFGDRTVVAPAIEGQVGRGTVATSDDATRLASAAVVFGERRFTASWAAGLAGLTVEACEVALAALVGAGVVRVSAGGAEAEELPALYRWVPGPTCAALVSAAEVEAARRRLPAVARSEAIALTSGPEQRRSAVYGRTRSLWVYVLRILAGDILVRLGEPNAGMGPAGLHAWLDAARVTLSDSTAAECLPDILVALSPWLGQPFLAEGRRWHFAGYTAARALGRSKACEGQLAARIAGSLLPDFASALPWLEEARLALTEDEDLAAVYDRLSEARAVCGDVPGSHAAALASLRLTPAGAGVQRASRLNNAGVMGLVLSGSKDWETTLRLLSEGLRGTDGPDAKVHHARAVIRWNLAVLAWTRDGVERDGLPLNHPDNAVLVDVAAALASTFCAAGQLGQAELRRRLRELARVRTGERQAAWALGALAFHGHHYLAYEEAMVRGGDVTRIPLIAGRLGIFAAPPPNAPSLRLAFLYDVRGAVSVLDESLLLEMRALASEVAGRADASLNYIDAMREELGRARREV
jgi:hypothetical protein